MRELFHPNFKFYCTMARSDTGHVLNPLKSVKMCFVFRDVISEKLPRHAEQNMYSVVLYSTKSVCCMVSVSYELFIFCLDSLSIKHSGVLRQTSEQSKNGRNKGSSARLGENSKKKRKERKEEFCDCSFIQSHRIDLRMWFQAPPRYSREE